MSQVSDERIIEAILSVTSGPDWDVFKHALAQEIFALQGTSLDAESWDEIKEARGFARGLAFVINIRETTLALLEMQKEANDGSV